MRICSHVPIESVRAALFDREFENRLITAFRPGTLNCEFSAGTLVDPINSPSKVVDTR